MKPEFAVVVVWFLLIACPLVAFMSVQAGRRRAHEMGERYTAPKAASDNFLVLMMLGNLPNWLERAHYLPHRSLASVILLLVVACVLLYGLLFSPKNSTWQRYTKWKIARKIKP